MHHHRPHHSCSPSAPLVLNIRSMIWHEKKGLLWIIHYGRKDKMCRHYKNGSKLLTIKNESASEYAISHIHSHIPVLLQKISKMKVSVTPITKEQLITCWFITRLHKVLKVTAKWNKKNIVISLLFYRRKNILFLKEQHIDRIIRCSQFLYLSNFSHSKNNISPRVKIILFIN